MNKNVIKWLLVSAGLGAALVWAYWPTFVEMAARWSHEAQYSHGYLVPFFAAFLVYARRDRLAKCTPKVSWVGGLTLLVVAAVMRLSAAYFYLSALDALSLLPCVAGLVLLLGGWGVFAALWPAVAFLAFMLPLPFRVETALAAPLQRISTMVSTYTLQTFGFPALADGNVIRVKEHSIGVVEACSGLSMMMVFFALATAFVLLVNRPMLDKILLLISAVPIAIISNVARITVTAVLYETVNSEAADRFFHDFAGLLMMPLALLLLGLEVWILNHLLVEPEKRKLMTAGLPSGAGKAAGTAASTAIRPVVRTTH
jgi:exosortase